MAHLLPVVSSLDMSALAPVGCPSDPKPGRTWDVSMKYPPPHPARRSGELVTSFAFSPPLFFSSMPGHYVWGNLSGNSYREALLRLPHGFSVLRLQHGGHLGGLVTE